MTSTGKHTSSPANVGLADSTLRVTPARLIRVCGIETRNTAASKNKSREIAALFWLDAAYHIAARRNSSAPKPAVGYASGNFPAFTGPARCEADYQRASVRFARTVRGRA